MPLSDSNIPQKLASLKKSKFRSKFHLSQKDRDYIATKGLETIKEHAFQFINSRIAPAYPKNDSKQTPMKNHPVFIAQHARDASSLKPRHQLPRDAWFGNDQGCAW
jgi:hypothetical protein